MLETTANDSGRKTSFNSGGIQDRFVRGPLEHGFLAAFNGRWSAHERNSGGEKGRLWLTSRFDIFRQNACANHQD